jgi:hypothetical protein
MVRDPVGVHARVVALLLAASGVLEAAREVESAAEVVACTLEHDHLHVGVAIRAREGVVHALDH